MKILFLAIFFTLFGMPAFASDDIQKYFMFMGFHLEKTKLTEIVKKFGDAPIFKKGDAGDFYTAICYRVPKKKITIYFESGEMGSGETLLGYRVMQQTNSDFPCGHTKSKLIEEYNKEALEIGNNFKKTIGDLPHGGNAREGNVFYYLNKIPFTKEEIKETGVQDLNYAFWDQNITFTLYSNDSILNGFRVTKVTSY